MRARMISVIAIVAALPLTARPQDTLLHGPNLKYSGPLPKLQMSLYKTTVIEGEPLLATFSVEADAQKAGLCPWGDATCFARGDFRIEVRDGTGKSVGEWLEQGADGPPWKRSFAPGEKLACVKLFSLYTGGPGKWRILSPGQYTLRAFHLWYSEEIPAQSVDLTVVPAAGNDRDALDLLRRMGPFGWDSGLRVEQQPIYTIPSRYPDSTYAPYIRYMQLTQQTARVCSEQVRSQLTEQQLREQAEQVAGQCSAFLQRSLPQPMKRRVEFCLARLEQVLRRQQDASARLQRLNAEPGWEHDDIASRARLLLFGPQMHKHTATTTSPGN